MTENEWLGFIATGKEAAMRCYKASAYPEDTEAPLSSIATTVKLAVHLHCVGQIPIDWIDTMIKEMIRQMEPENSMKLLKILGTWDVKEWRDASFDTIHRN